MTIRPAGYDLDDLNPCVVTPNESVAHATGTVFAKLEEFGSARQVMLWWKQQELKYRVRRMDLRTHPIQWREPNYRMLLRTLHHPIDAGVYAFGRMTTVRQIDAVEPENRTVARELERRWNEKLNELERVRQQAQSARVKTTPLTEEEMTRARQLAQDLEQCGTARQPRIGIASDYSAV